MSKFKILVNCRNYHKLQNVLTNMDGICDYISTSGFAEDIMMHRQLNRLKYFPQEPLWEVLLLVLLKDQVY